MFVSLLFSSLSLSHTHHEQLWRCECISIWYSSSLISAFVLRLRERETFTYLLIVDWYPSNPIKKKNLSACVFVCLENNFSHNVFVDCLKLAKPAERSWVSFKRRPFLSPIPSTDTFFSPPVPSSPLSSPLRLIFLRLPAEEGAGPTGKSLSESTRSRLREV